MTLDDGEEAFSLLNRNLPIYMRCPHCRSSDRKGHQDVKFPGAISQLQRIFIVTPDFPLLLASCTVVQFENRLEPVYNFIFKWHYYSTKVSFAVPVEDGQVDQRTFEENCLTVEEAKEAAAYGAFTKIWDYYNHKLMGKPIEVIPTRRERAESSHTGAMYDQRYPEGASRERHTFVKLAGGKSPGDKRNSTMKFQPVFPQGGKRKDAGHANAVRAGNPGAGVRNRSIGRANRRPAAATPTASTRARSPKG